MGRTIRDVRVLITQLRTCPSRPTFTLTILPKGHCPLGVFSSATKTTSPICMSVFDLCHFCRVCNAGKYSRIHRLQNTLARYCTCLHHRLAYTSSLTKTPCGMLGLDFMSNNMLGVNAGGLLGRCLQVLWACH